MLFSEVASGHLTWSSGCPAPGGAEWCTGNLGPEALSAGTPGVEAVGLDWGLLDCGVSATPLSSLSQRPPLILGKCPTLNLLSPLLCSGPLASSLGLLLSAASLSTKLPSVRCSGTCPRPRPSTLNPIQQSINPPLSPVCSTPCPLGIEPHVQALLWAQGTQSGTS